ncbi:MAG: suppressor of fused domain protein [Streptosporangiaceae bacterium]|nr:suppressor of fused domain protein [Streptosporangiaceae bacterium]
MATSPVTLLESVSPYGSRKVTVEYDGLTTAAYVYDDSGPVSATWIANHRPAPPVTDQVRLDAGRAPLMPASRTRHPGGRAPLQAAALAALWFEEGDGVAILENGRPLAVLAGWSDMQHGMPGYSRDIIGQTPFGWSLDDAMDGLAPRLQRSRAYWRWRRSPGGWEEFSRALFGHLAARLGPAGHYWDASAGAQPAVGITERPAAPRRRYTVLSTVGMSCQRMPAVEQVLEDPSGYARVELAIATTLPSAQAARVFGWLATYPWRAVTWFGPGHSVRWYHEAATFPLGAGAEAVLLLDSPGSLPGPQPPDLSGFRFGGDPVRWLWIVPISEPERRLAKERGSASLVARLAEQDRSWVLGPDERAG